MSHTVSGKTCQTWAAQTPHKHTIGVFNEEFPEESVLKAKFYCRNPSNNPVSPWCYTADPNSRWEYCDVPGFTVGEVRTKLWHIAYTIRISVYPIIVMIGTLLNILSIYTFTRPTLLKKPISFLFIILAIVDTLSLHMGAFEQWIKLVTGSHLSTTNNLSCRVFGYIYYI